ncbi:hypothetical protein [Pseudomonas sp. JAI120]|uniref:hypothetical protein n=1 Tax=Pseudomonas sp. JAI120 TaxID=2723063 RepID=UPI0030D9E211
MSDLINRTVENRVATSVLNRPEVRNALSPELIESLIEEFRAVERAPLVKCIINRTQTPPAMTRPPPSRAWQ